jgi:hypothetical protein
MNNNIPLTLAFVLLLFVFSANAEPRFSLSWENSYLTGSVNLKNSKPDDYDLVEEIKGGQSLFTFRCQINDYFSVGVGSGAHINKLNFSIKIFLDASDFSVGMLFIPIFTELRTTLPIYDKLLFVYASSKIGGSIAPLKIDNSGEHSIWEDYFENGFFLENMLGVLINKKRFSLDLGLGYHLQTSKFVEYYYYYDDYWDDEPKERLDKYPFNLNQFIVKFGMGILF